MKATILKWLRAKDTRSVYAASIQFNLEPQKVWDILNEVDGNE